MLNNKYIPLKLLENTNDNQYLLAAWHWRWSITWRWLIKWSPGRYKMCFNYRKTNQNGYGNLIIGMGYLGLVYSSWQPNMDREKAMQAEKEQGND